MKRRSFETNKNHEHPKNRNEQETSLLRKALAIVGIAGVASTSVLVTHSVMKNLDAPKRAETGVNAHHDTYRQALEQELKTAYEGPVAIDQAENTHDTTTRFGDKRGVIKFHLDGSGKNEETAQSKGTPSYMYGENPHAHLVSMDGKPISAGAIAVWKSNQENGDAVLYPRLANFAGSKPKTLDYKIDLEAEGYLQDGTDLTAEYDAGDILVTGSNGEITSIDVHQRSQNEPPIELHETK